MSRSLAVARVGLYAALAAGVARAPDVAATIALLPPTHFQPVLSDASAGPASLGWLGTALAATLARAFGFAGLALGTVLALVATLALVEWRARRTSPPWLALGAAALVAVCSIDAAHAGGGASVGFFFAAFALALDLAGTRGLIALAVAAAVWCNASATGVLAPVFALAYALGASLDRRPAPERRHAQLGAVVAALATLATPAFAAFPLLAWRSLGFDGTLSDILPGAPATVAPLGYQIGAMLTIVVALAAGARAARSGATLLAVVAAYLAFSKGIFVPSLAIAAGPVLAQSLARRTGARIADVRATTADRRRHAFALTASAVAVAVVVAAVSVRTLPPLANVQSEPPFGALARYAGAPGTHGRLLCTKLAWCDVAERRYGIDVVADTRVATASDDVIAAQRTIAGAKQHWESDARANDVAAIFVDRRSGFATLLAADGWTTYATDGTGVLFLRAGARR